MRSRTAYVIIVAIVIGLGRVARGDNSGAERFRSNVEKVNLIEKVAEPWHAVSRLLVEYEAGPSSEATTAEGLVHRRLAVSAPGELYHLGSHFSRLLPWQEDPYAQEYFIHQGKTCHRWPFNRNYSEGTLEAGDTIPGSIWMDVLLSVLPRWPLAAYKLPADGRSGIPVILVEALRSTDCRLLANSESVNGEVCAVFDYKGIERIWIATNKGLCVMRRDAWDPRSKKLLTRILTDKVDQIAPGLWLPTTYRMQFFRAGRGANEDIFERENRIRSLRCLLNENVPESVFIPVHRPGSLNYGKANRFTQMTPGGEDLLDDVINFMVNCAKLPTKPIPHGRSYLWLLAGLASGSYLGFSLFPMNKNRAKRSVPGNRNTDVPLVAQANRH